MALYDREFGYGRPRDTWGMERSQWARPSPRADRPSHWDQAYNRGYDWGMSDRYLSDRAGYDRGYKSRWQTDYGDPFGDRQRHTPIRVIPDEYRGRNRAWETTYDREYNASPYPFGYLPYAERAGYDEMDYLRSYRGHRRPDSRWF